MTSRTPEVTAQKETTQQAQDERSRWVGSTLGEVLAHLNAAEESLEQVQEPPGKLRAIVVPADANRGVEVAIWLVYDGGPLFSEKGTWVISEIKGAKVRGLKFTEGETVTRYGEPGLGQWPESR